MTAKGRALREQRALVGRALQARVSTTTRPRT
jgi:hypothetical protein